MRIDPNCEHCEPEGVVRTCTDEEIMTCMSKAKCPVCGHRSSWLPNGPSGDRKCRYCQAQWPVQK